MKKKTDYTFVLMLIILLAAILSSCGVTIKGSCSGNKTMAFFGGNSRKPFTK